jgi:hypothetical protein
MSNKKTLFKEVETSELNSSDFFYALGMLAGVLVFY